MEKQFNTLNGTQREVVINVSQQELQPHFEQAYHTAQPEIEMKGFRKGKVPLQLIKQKFGKQIENNAIEDIASKLFNEAVREQGVHPIGQPSLTDMQRKPDGGMSFTIKYEVVPEFELGEYRGLVVDQMIHTVAPEEVEKEILQLRLERGAMEEAEQVEDDNSLVTVQFRKIDQETGMPLIGEESEEMEVFLGNERVDPGLKASLLHTKIGDSFRYEVNDEKNEGQKIPFLASVKTIKRIVPAEFTNEFVEAVTQGNLMTTEDFFEEIERQLKEMWKNKSKQHLEDTIVTKVIEAHEFDIPQTLVQEILASYVNEFRDRRPDKKLPQDFNMQVFVQEMLPTAYRTAKWVILRERIIEKEGLKVEETDIDRFMQNLPGNLEMEPEQLRAVIESDEQVRSRLLSEKVLDLLRDYAVITEVSDNHVH